MKTEKKRRLAELFKLCPVRHVLLLLGLCSIAVFLLCRGNYELMARVSEGFVRPLHRKLALLNSFVSFSMAEVIILIFIAATLFYLVYMISSLIIRPQRLRRLYRLVITLVTLFAQIYALFCLMWGVYYYGDDFSAKSGIKANEISVEQLENVTKYFAALTNKYSTEVERNDDATCATDKARVLEASPGIYNAAEALYPCLEGDDIAAKGIFFSREMSYIDFTGFFFPYTAEANVNTDVPSAYFAATVAHELSHQRGVAKEQEANFTAVLCCMESTDADYLYSGCLLAYIHLSNALYKEDYEAWKEVYYSLNNFVIADLEINRAYWAQFDTPVQTVSNTVYEGFLQSYDQKLGLKSYGACVDLLVNFYEDEAQAYLSE